MLDGVAISSLTEALRARACVRELRVSCRTRRGGRHAWSGNEAIDVRVRVEDECAVSVYSTCQRGVEREWDHRERHDAQCHRVPWSLRMTAFFLYLGCQVGSIAARTWRARKRHARLPIQHPPIIHKSGAPAPLTRHTQTHAASCRLEHTAGRMAHFRCPALRTSLFSPLRGVVQFARRAPRASPWSASERVAPALHSRPGCS